MKPTKPDVLDEALCPSHCLGLPCMLPKNHDADWCRFVRPDGLATVEWKSQVLDGEPE